MASALASGRNTFSPHLWVGSIASSVAPPRCGVRVPHCGTATVPVLNQDCSHRRMRRITVAAVRRFELVQTTFPMAGGKRASPMPDENDDVLKALEGLEQAAEVLEEAISAHTDAAMKTKL